MFTSLASLCCCSFFRLLFSFFLSLFWLVFPMGDFPERGFPAPRPPFGFPASESDSESESTCSRAKRDAVVGTEIIVDAILNLSTKQSTNTSHMQSLYESFSDSTHTSVKDRLIWKAPVVYKPLTDVCKMSVLHTV